MLKKLSKEKMGASNLGWLQSRFHFSFAEYYNRNNMNFGVLRVLNDDLIHPQKGFEMHPHKDMEIISYIVDGAITHKDSMGNQEDLYRGEVQYLSAGDGIYHSEYNNQEKDILRLLQIWIMPPAKSLPRLYGSRKFLPEERKNKLLHIISSQNGNAPIKIYQDVNIFVCELDENNSITYRIAKNRQVYYTQIEGRSNINNKLELDFGDALEIVDEDILSIEAETKTHFLFIEMAKG